MYNKASKSDLRELSSFLLKNAKKQPIHSGSFWRRYVYKENAVKFLLTIFLLMALNSFTFKGAVDKPDGWWPWHHFTEDVNLAINSNFSLTVRTDDELEMDSNKLAILPADEAEAWAVGGALLSAIIYTYSYSLW